MEAFDPDSEEDSLSYRIRKVLTLVQEMQSAKSTGANVTQAKVQAILYAFPFGWSGGQELVPCFSIPPHPPHQNE